MGKAWDPAAFRKMIQGKGEDWTRDMLDGGRFGGPNDEENRVATNWLRELDREREADWKADTRGVADRMLWLGAGALIGTVGGLAVNWITRSGP